MPMNINSREYWDTIYKREGFDTWRKQPASFFRVCELLGKGQDYILEVGCGVGILASRIAKLGHVVKGLDISGEAVRLFNENVQAKNCSAKRAQVPPIPYADNSFDVCIACETLEHYHAPQNLVKECRRVAPIGIFTVPNNTLPPSECKEHYQCWSTETFKEFLLQFYSTVEIYTDINTMQDKESKSLIVSPTIVARCYA